MKIVHSGKEQPLEHLTAGLSFPCPCKAIERDLIIRIHFTSHCYTEAFDATKHKPHEIVCSDGPDRHRVFCPIRYKLSFKLPELLCDLPKWRVHQTAERRNYVYVVPLTISNQLYEIYFMLQRAQTDDKADLRLTVESAYPVKVQTPTPKRPGAIRFFVLAQKVLRNEPIKFAPR